MAAQKRATVYVLDVSFFTFRAYYALPPLTTSAGLPTNAIHGVASMLERLIRDEKPKYLAAAFDGPEKTFRSDLFPEYKANRDEPDEELRVQFPLVRRLIDAMGIVSIIVPGFEADDILATLAARLSAEGNDVVIVTGDKDLMQCVTDRVSLFDAVKGKRVKAPQVEEKFGVAPSAVTDVQGLMGDSTDNIPGVRGVGPKTATALIQHFGSIESMLDRPEEIESLGIRGAAGVRKKIEEGAQTALLSKQLATVRTDVPIDNTLEELAFKTPHTEELLALAEELEMERTAERLRNLLGVASPEGEASGKSEKKAKNTGAVDRAGQFDFDSAEASMEDAVEIGRDWQAIRDAKGAAKQREYLCLFANAERGQEPMLGMSRSGVRVLIEGETQVRAALEGLAAAELSPSGHDLKAVCRDYGVAPGPQSLDFGVCSYLYDPSVGDHTSADIAERFLGEPVVVPERRASAIDRGLEQLERLLPIMRRALTKHRQDKLYDEIELPLVAILGRLEARGILLDTAILARLSKDFDQRMKALVGKVYEAAGQEFNILSPVQLRELLFNKLGLPTKGIKKTKTGPSTDSDSLTALADKHPLPALVLEYRALAKLKSTYVDSLPRMVDEQSRIHTRLNQTVTATGRLSSKDPNLQNIPIRTDDGRKIRTAFVAGPGRLLVSADYNQIELRVLAHLAKDGALISAFEQGLDIHTATAAELFSVDPEAVTPEMRRSAKVINYGIIYGMGPVRMSRELGIARSDAAGYIENYFARYAGVRRFYDETLAGARRHGYVATLLGRRRYLPDLESEHGGLRQAAERVATNTPIQGSAADIIKTAMIRLDTRLAKSGLEAALVLQIHDELLVECPEPELDQVVTLVQDAMEGAAELVVPIKVDIGSGPDWGSAH